MLPPIVIALMAPFRAFYGPGLGARAGARHRHGAGARQRTVSAALRVMGLGATRDFAL